MFNKGIIQYLTDSASTYTNLIDVLVVAGGGGGGGIDIGNGGGGGADNPRPRCSSLYGHKCDRDNRGKC